MTVSIPQDFLFFCLLCALIGLIVGSFLNVVILRLPRMLEQTSRQEYYEKEVPSPKTGASISLSRPRSYCPHCSQSIKPWHNIPLISWVLLLGKCAHCGVSISIRYPLVEIVTSALSAATAYKFGFGPECFSALILIWILIALIGIDIDTQLLPDNLTMPLLWSGLGCNIFAIWTTLPSAVLGAMLGYLSLWSVYWLFKLATGKEGIGYGDFKLLAALGAWFGWQAIPLMILLSSSVGAILGVTILLIRQQDSDTPLPFGPYLGGTGILMLFFGDNLITGYLGLIGL